MPIEVMAERGPTDAARSGRCGRSGSRSAHRPAPVRGRAASPGDAPPDRVQPGRLPDAPRVPRAAAHLPDDPRPRAGRVPALRLDPSQHVRRRAARLGADARAAHPPDRALRRPAHRRRGLHRVDRDGSPGWPLAAARAKGTVVPPPPPERRSARSTSTSRAGAPRASRTSRRTSTTACCRRSPGARPSAIAGASTRSAP